APVNYNGTDGQTIYIRIEYLTSGCYETESFTLNVQGQPTINPVADLEVCDDGNNDGMSQFDLESQSLTILGAQPATDFEVTYHLSFADADSDTGALTSPYTNVNNPELIFVRVENIADSNCYNVSALPLFNLIVNNTGIANGVGDFEVCDLNGDGLEIFDLTSQTATILGAQMPADVTISFHESQADADNNVAPIATPNAHTNVGNPQTIYVRVEDNINTICYTTTAFDLIVNSIPPVVVPAPLQLCDDSVADGITVFDLTVKDGALTGGNADYIVTYYETMLDAVNDTSPIPDPTNYNSTANPQILHVRVTDTVTSCFSTTTLEIEVLANPLPETDPDDIVLCDDVNTGDNVEVFDLTVNEVQILNGQAVNILTYHNSFNDAEQNIGAIATPTNYTNASNPETIFVRVVNPQGCFTVVDFDLLVNPLPEVIAVPDLIECELNTDGLFDFDLESKTNELLNGQSPAIFGVTYHVSQIDADNNANPLVSPYTNVLGNPQTIYVSITNTTTGCSISTVEFNIEVRDQPTATAPANDYVICDYFGDNDGVAEFDLSTQDAEILNGQLPADFTVTYFAGQMDAIDGVNALMNIYENTSNPQVIYARVDNNSGICYELVEVTLRVQPIPVFSLNENYVICLDGDGNVIVNGNSPPVIDTGLSDADFTFEWSYEGTVLPGESLSTLTANQAGNYSVAVADISGLGCIGDASTVVLPSTAPIVEAEVTTDAFADNHIVEVTATGNGEYEFSIDGGPWELGTDNGNGTYSYTFTNVNPPGEHLVTARDRQGCGEDSETVFVFDYPLFFTPNSDGYNDTWNIIDFSGQPSAKIFIYDRYGKLLKQISPSGNGWNGTFNGTPLPSTDYWFTVTYIEPRDGTQKNFRSHFTLKR
ncbi:MAG: T9SS type B sorting domain-containing protein, partial [Flavobacteriaceae bacterium]